MNGYHYFPSSYHEKLSGHAPTSIAVIIAQIASAGTLCAGHDKFGASRSLAWLKAQLSWDPCVLQFLVDSCAMSGIGLRQ
jgi:hypothetical protein